MAWDPHLPALNALLNTLSAILLVMGYREIRRGNPGRHKKLMLAAFGTSTLFLISYLRYHTEVGSVKFQGTGPIRLLYFAILIPHVILATVMVPFILTLLARALRGDFAGHRRIARKTWMVWLYVSVTGVLVFLMLYVLFPAPRGI